MIIAESVPITSIHGLMINKQNIVFDFNVYINLEARTDRES